jgi:hypothetical protein
VTLSLLKRARADVGNEQVSRDVIEKPAQSFDAAGRSAPVPATVIASGGASSSLPRAARHSPSFVFLLRLGQFSSTVYQKTYRSIARQ